MNRRLVAVAAAVAVAVGGGIALVARKGEEAPPEVRDPLAAALAAAPASAPVVAVVETDAEDGQGRALAELADRFGIARFGEALLRERVGPITELRGAPLVAWGAGLHLEGLAAAIVVEDDGRREAVLDDLPERGGLRAAGPLVVGADGPLVVAAQDARTVRDALDRARRGAGLTPQVLRDRLGALRDEDALVRVVGLPRVLADGRLQGTPFGDALRGLALTVRAADPGLRFRFALAHTRLEQGDAPLAFGPQPPRPAGGDAPQAIAVRDLRVTVDWLEEHRGRLDIEQLRGVEDALATLDRVRGPLRTFGRIDVDEALLDQLTGTTTITREPRGGTSVRAELRDGDDLRTALRRISAVPDFALDAAGAGDFDLDRSGDDAFTYVLGDRTLLRLAVLGDVLVATTDPGTGLRELANRRAEAAAGGGALHLDLTGPAVQELLTQRLGLPALARLALGGIGELRAWARAAPTGIAGEATLALRG